MQDLSESGWTTPPFIFEMHELILLCTERSEQHRYQNYTCIHQLSSLPQVSRLGPYVKHTSEHDLSDNILCLVMFIGIYLKNGKSVFRFGESMFYAVIREENAFKGLPECKITFQWISVPKKVISKSEQILKFCWQDKTLQIKTFLQWIVCM